MSGLRIVTMGLETVATLCCWELQAYSADRGVDKFHYPNVFVRSLPKPELRAVVAAPIYKMWPLTWESSTSTVLIKLIISTRPGEKLV